MVELKNYMEILVDQIFDKTTQDMDICKCERCRLDIMAIALNKLEPRYVVSDQGYLYTKLNMIQQQHSADVIAAITQASMVVGGNKNHE